MTVTLVVPSLRHFSGEPALVGSKTKDLVKRSLRLDWHQFGELDPDISPA